MKRHRYTVREQSLVRRLYGELSAEELATRIHGTPRAAVAIYRLAHRLGLRKSPDLREHYEPVRRLHAEGLTDADIGRRLGLDRRCVCEIRVLRLGLPVNAAAVLEANRRGVVTQRRTLGIRHGGDLRRLAYRKFARERGWPEDLRPRAVQILELLAVAGPMDRWQIAEKIDWNLARSRGKVNGQRCLLASNDPEGSYLAHLLKRGLVVYQHRSRPSGRQGGGRIPGLYMLSPATKVLLDFVSKSAPTPQMSIGARLNVAGHRPVNGHNGDDDEVRDAVAGLLQGDRLGKTTDGITRLLGGRHSEAAVAGAIDAMLSDGELVAEDGRYCLAERP